MAESSSVLPIDTQRAVEELVASGMPSEQAAVLVRLQAHWAGRDFATGEDVDRLRADVAGDFERLRADIAGDFERLRTDLEGKIEAQGAALTQDISHLRQDMDRRFEAQGAAIGQLREDVERRFDAQGAAFGKDLQALRGALEARIVGTANNTLKWVTGAQVGTAAVFMAGLLAALKL